MIVQRQYANPSVVEMEFTGLKQLILYPPDEGYTCEILDATIIVRDGLICWYDSDEVIAGDFSDYRGMLLCAAKVRWRAADEYIGPNEVYTAMSDQER